jgi:hypothetical protein
MRFIKIAILLIIFISVFGRLKTKQKALTLLGQNPFIDIPSKFKFHSISFYVDVKNYFDGKNALIYLLIDENENNMLTPYLAAHFARKVEGPEREEITDPKLNNKVVYLLTLALTSCNEFLTNCCFPIGNDNFFEFWVIQNNFKPSPEYTKNAKLQISNLIMNINNNNKPGQEYGEKLSKLQCVISYNIDRSSYFINIKTNYYIIYSLIRELGVQDGHMPDYKSGLNNLSGIVDEMNLYDALSRNFILNNKTTDENLRRLLISFITPYLNNLAKLKKFQFLYFEFFSYLEFTLVVFLMVYIFRKGRNLTIDAFLSKHI